MVARVPPCVIAKEWKTTFPLLAWRRCEECGQDFRREVGETRVNIDYGDFVDRVYRCKDCKE